MIQYRNLSSVLVCILLFLFTVNAFGQSKNHSREQMHQDIDILFSTIEEAHPEMCAIYPKTQLDKDIEDVKSKLESSGDILYFYKQVAPLVVKLGDGHTSIYPPAEPDFYTHIFPFFVKITYPDKVISIQNDFTETQNKIPVGAQITTINNRKANDIVQEMLNYVSGEKDFYKISKLEQSLFIRRLHVLYRDSIFDIEYIFNQEKHSLQAKGISLKKIEEIVSQQNITVSNPYTFKFLPEKNIGIIEFNSFSDLDRFKVFLDSTFQVLQKEKIENLIIDLRKNGGGNSSLGDELFQYISPVPFTQYGKNIVKYSDIQKLYYKTRFNFEVSNHNGIVIQNENAKLIELRENNLRYKGNIFLLISHYTFSSAADFSWAFKYFKMGTVVGEETGGMAVSFGNFIEQTLPNSGLHYSISIKKFYNYGTTDDNIHGTLPDYQVEADKALDFSIDLITQK